MNTAMEKIIMFGFNMVQHECFVDSCLFFCTFYFGHCVVCFFFRYTDSDYPFDIFKLFLLLKAMHRIGGVIVNVLASSAVDRGFEPQLGQTKDYTIGMRCYSAKHAVLRRKSKDWLARNQDNVSEWGDMSISGLLFQGNSIM